MRTRFHGDRVQPMPEVAMWRAGSHEWIGEHRQKLQEKLRPVTVRFSLQGPRARKYLFGFSVTTSTQVLML